MDLFRTGVYHATSLVDVFSALRCTALVQRAAWLRNLFSAFLLRRATFDGVYTVDLLVCLPEWPMMVLGLLHDVPFTPYLMTGTAHLTHLYSAEQLADGLTVRKLVYGLLVECLYHLFLTHPGHVFGRALLYCLHCITRLTGGWTLRAVALIGEWISALTYCSWPSHT